MNKDDIIRMAQEAGLPIFDANAVSNDPAEQAMADIVTKVWHDSAERFAALVAAAKEAELMDSMTIAYMDGYEKGKDAGAAAEREACAKVCDEEGLLWGQRYAATIRARGQA